MKKAIAIIVPKLTEGGAERTAANLSVILSKYYAVHLIVFDSRDISYPYGGTLHDIKMLPRGSVLRGIINIIKRINTVKKIKKEFSIFASISLMEYSNLVNVLSKSGDKVISSVRNYMSKAPSMIEKGTAQKMKFIADRSAKVVAVSNGVGEDLIENFGVPNDKVITIYNPCNGELLKEKAQVHIHICG